jgi:uncharacterized protein YraI
VSNGKVYVSESGWKISSKKPTSASDLYFHYGTPWHSDLKGYIYVLDGEKSSAKNVDYSIKITSSKLNMRKGPGTTYDSVGYVKAGTYEVSQECGDWAKLSSNGYWVCLSFATKVSTAKETVVDTGTTTNYKVKVSVTNLNMRLGPGTSYKSKGYLDPGTYTVVKTSGTWGKLSETGYWISLNYATKVATSSSTNKTTTTTSTSTSSSSSLYKVKVTAIGLRMRTGPGTSYSSKGVAIKGTTYDIKDTKNGWGQLSKNGYWIKLSYTVPVNAEYNVKVTAKDLNMRTGPGILYAKKGYIKPGTYTITETSGGWGKLKTNGYWIKLSYVTKI